MFRVALYCSGNQHTAWDSVYTVESPRPLHKVSQPLDLCTAIGIVDQMRVLHEQQVGIVADSRPLAEFYSQAAFEAKPLSGGSGVLSAECLAELDAGPPCPATVASAMPCGLNADITLGVVPAPHAPPAKLSPDKPSSPTWWEWLLALLFGRPEEDCCAK